MHCFERGSRWHEPVGLKIQVADDKWKDPRQYAYTRMGEGGVVGIAWDFDETSGNKGFGVVAEEDFKAWTKEGIMCKPLYEIWPETLHTKLYMDLEAYMEVNDDCDVRSERILEVCVRVLGEFALAMGHPGVDAFQVSNASAIITTKGKRLYKMSYHVVANNAYFMGASSSICTIHPRRHYQDSLKVFVSEVFLKGSPECEEFLFVPDIRKETPRKACVIDYCISKRFQLFRMLYAQKQGYQGFVTGPLLPVLKSSEDPWDHLVGVYGPSNAIAISWERFESFLQKHGGQQKMRGIRARKSSSSMPPREMAEVPAPEVKYATDKFMELHPDSKLLGVRSTGEWIKFEFAPSEHPCRIAGRRHSSDGNTPYLAYNRVTGGLKYHCFDEECVAKVGEKGFVHPVTIQGYWDAQPHSWAYDEEYCEETMRPYPPCNLDEDCVRQTIIVDAQKGCGKTVAAIEFLARHDPSSSLIIGHSRSLLFKHYIDTEKKLFPMTHYVEDAGEYFIEDDHVIICMNSLRRLRRIYDVVIIDEIDSLLGATDCSLIDSKHSLMQRLALHLQQTKVLLIMDANVNSQRVYDFITTVRGRAQSEYYYIRNTYIRPTNRRAIIQQIQVPNQVPKADEIIADLEAGFKVVVASASRGWALELKEAAEKTLPGIGIKCYVQDTRDVLMKDMLAINDSWCVDLLIYSPVVGAGVSMERLHFDKLYVFANNSPRAPPVSTILQMMFRVRQLREGSMTIYYHEAAGNLPYVIETKEAAGEALGKDDRRVFNIFGRPPELDFMSCGASQSRLSYNPEREDFQLYLNNMIVKSASSSRYLQILSEDLEAQGIKVCVAGANDAQEDATSKKRKHKDEVLENDEWKETYLKTKEEINKLVSKEEMEALDGPPLQAEEARTLEIFRAAVLYRLDYPGSLDNGFDEPSKEEYTDAYRTYTDLIRRSDRLFAEADDLLKRIDRRHVADFRATRDSRIQKARLPLRVLSSLLGVDATQLNWASDKVMHKVTDSQLLEYSKTPAFQEQIARNRRYISETYNYSGKFDKWTLAKIRNVVDKMLFFGLGISLSAGERTGKNKKKVYENQSIGPHYWVNLQASYGNGILGCFEDVRNHRPFVPV